MFKNIFGREGNKKGANEKDLYQPRMPEVDTPSKLEDVFNQARKTATGEIKPPNINSDDRYLVLVTPGRMLMHRPCPPAGSMSPSQVSSMERLIPSGIKRNVAVIAYTELRAVTTDLAKAIPFAGLLMGFAYIGHAVWIFEGHPSALAAGCNEADLLLVDGGMLPYLTENWIQIASSVMRHKEIYVHDRATYKLTRVGEK